MGQVESRSRARAVKTAILERAQAQAARAEAATTAWFAALEAISQAEQAKADAIVTMGEAGFTIPQVAEHFDTTTAEIRRIRKQHVDTDTGGGKPDRETGPGGDVDSDVDHPVS